MSELIEAMKAHMRYLVLEEHRPFSYIDFLIFEINGKEYKMAHGTFRNNISSFIEEGLVEIAYASSIKFYTLKGAKFGNACGIAVTGNHMGVPHSSALVSASTSSLTCHPLYRIIRNLPLGKNSVHDIHLRFSCPQIYDLTSSSIFTGAFCYDYAVNARSKDILLRA